jgi:hypothetical protein
MSLFPKECVLHPLVDHRPQCYSIMLATKPAMMAFFVRRDSASDKEQCRFTESLHADHSIAISISTTFTERSASLDLLCGYSISGAPSRPKRFQDPAKPMRALPFILPILGIERTKCCPEPFISVPRISSIVSESTGIRTQTTISSESNSIEATWCLRLASCRIYSNG